MQETDPPRPLTAAALAGVALMMAYQVGSRTTREALFLGQYNTRSWLVMVAVSAVAAIAAALLLTRFLVRLGPRHFVPRLFLVSAALTLAEWALVVGAPGAGVIVVYLHVAAITPLLLSGFWSIFSEEFDARSAKRSFGRLAAVGTIGGLAGFALGEWLTARIGAASTLPALACLQALAAWTIAILPSAGGRAAPARGGPPVSTGQAARRLVTERYARHLALIVVGGSVAATLLDYAFVLKATEGSSHALHLMRAFGGFNVLVAVATFPVQALASSLVLERLGVAPAIGALPGVMAVGGAIAALVPGPVSVTAARALGAIVRGSLFRTGYDVLYTAIPPTRLRATKALLDAGCDRLGDILGVGLIALLFLAAPASPLRVLLAACAVIAAATLLVVTRTRTEYVAALERGLLDGELQPADLNRREMTTLTTLDRLFDHSAPRLDPATAQDQVAMQRALTSPDAAQVRAALQAATPLDPALVPFAIWLLDREEVRRDAARALLAQAERDIGPLTAALVDARKPVVVRCRVARILARCPSQGAVDGLTRGLEAERFDVRHACGAALLRLVERDARLVVDRDRILAAVLREARIERGVWESRRTLGPSPEGAEEAYIDAFLGDRAGRSLEHVFVLLSLVLAREPLRIAFRGLLSGDPHLRGTALEYLELVLPPAVRQAIWSHLEPERSVRRAADAPPVDRAQVLADLMRSSPSIEIALDALRRGDDRAAPAPDR